jgi:hypothetical protein
MVATQGLFLLNDASVLSAADSTARRLLARRPSADPEGLVDTLFEWVLGTPAGHEERADVLAFVRQTQNRLAADGGQDAELRAWSLACQALFASSRFQFLD